MPKETGIVKVLAHLQKQRQDGPGWTWVRRIAKETGLHREEVRRIVSRYLAQALQEAETDDLFSAGFRVKLFRLRDGVTAKGHLRWLRAVGKL